MFWDTIFDHGKYIILGFCMYSKYRSRCVDVETFILLLGIANHLSFSAGLALYFHRHSWICLTARDIGSNYEDASK
jgi:hypothetical protein